MIGTSFLITKYVQLFYIKVLAHHISNHLSSMLLLGHIRPWNTISQRNDLFKLRITAILNKDLSFLRTCVRKSNTEERSNRTSTAGAARSYHSTKHSYLIEWSIQIENYCNSWSRFDIYVWASSLPSDLSVLYLLCLVISQKGKMLQMKDRVDHDLAKYIYIYIYFEALIRIIHFLNKSMFDRNRISRTSLSYISIV